MQQRQEPPKYKVLKFVAFGGIPYKKDAVIERHVLWPMPHELEPLNEGAQRIADFWAKHHGCRNFPDRPYDWRLTHRYYLPGDLGWQGRGTLPPFIAIEDAPEGAPMYKASARNDQFVFFGWPDQYWQAASSSAEKIVRYLAEAENATNPMLPLSPWNCFDNSLWLPELPEQKPRDNLLTMTDAEMAASAA
jgi:hypothetical protein